MKNISNIIEIQEDNKENMEICKELKYIEQHLEEYPHYGNWKDLKNALLSND